MAYAKAVAKTPIVYDSHQYPYFFTNKNASGKSDASEAKYGNKYKTWTPRLLRATYNYQYVAKDPGDYAHNPAYTVQLLHDSLADLGTKVKIDMAAMARPGG